MGRIAALIVAYLAATGCRQIFGLEPSVMVAADAHAVDDGPPVVVVDGRPDTPPGQTCVGSGLVTVCFDEADVPSDPMLVQTQVTIDTSVDTNCTRAQQQGPGLPELCIRAADTITISTNGRLRAIGTRPLVLVAIRTVQIMSVGYIDVSSNATSSGAGATTMLCAGTLGGGNDLGASSAAGAGGAGGGGFSGSGGTGGTGGSGSPGDGGVAGAVVLLTHIRAGCRGGAGGNSSDGPGGTSGSGGGAVYVIAGESIDISGFIIASGAGGRGGAKKAGGGGGGSGGLIGLDAPVVMTAAGSAVYANGGGGGEGGGDGNPGEDGANGTLPNQQAAGGNAVSNGGNGGNGSAQTILNGGTGLPGSNGGGGGGGGAGYIKLYMTTSTIAGSVSPPAT